MAGKDPRDQLIVALDLPSGDKARHYVRALRDTITTFKVGSQLFTAAGPQFVCELAASGYKVFLDLKFHDIPNTVAAAVRSVAALGASMLTVHASGGIKMLRAAVEAASHASRPPLVLAVTVLTSLNDDDLAEIGVAGKVPDQVLRLAALARDAGCDGIIASPWEVSELRRQLGAGFAIITPGVRPREGAAGDQVRVSTPTEAIAAGATHLVVGRPIIEAGDPAGAARAVLQEMTAAVR